MLRCIIVDDEPPALVLLDTYVGRTPFLELKGSFSSAIDALKFLNSEPVDLVFLDINMPELNGIELARILADRRTDNETRVILTSAYDQFALEGYKLDVVDYLLKPFSYEEFYRAANKALRLVGKDAPVAAKTEDAFLYLKVEFQTVRVPFDSILYIEGLKDYAKVHLAGGEKPLLSIVTLKALEEKLPAALFMRVHKSYIISLRQVTAVTKNTVHIGKVEIPVTGQYKDPFAEFVSTWR